VDSKNREKSAIDVIYELSESVATIDKRLSVMDSNIKLLNNKLSKMSKEIFAISEAGPAPSKTKAVATAEPSVSHSKKIGKSTEPKKLVLGNISLYGYIVDPSKVPIIDAVINVIDADGDVIKDSRTNGDGFWSVRLPSGKYEVLYKMQGYKPTSRIVSLKDGVEKYEVR
jgi:hypothetical protein